ncbi:hypothetical protein HID58_025600, partial [Brassica napus]
QTATMTEVKEAESGTAWIHSQRESGRREERAPRNRVGWTSTKREVGGTTTMGAVQEAVAMR